MIPDRHGPPKSALWTDPGELAAVELHETETVGQACQQLALNGKRDRAGDVEQELVSPRLRNRGRQLVEMAQDRPGADLPSPHRVDAGECEQSRRCPIADHDRSHLRLPVRIVLHRLVSARHDRHQQPRGTERNQRPEVPNLVCRLCDDPAGELVRLALVAGEPGTGLSQLRQVIHAPQRIGSEHWAQQSDPVAGCAKLEGMQPALLATVAILVLIAAIYVGMWAHSRGAKPIIGGIGALLVPLGLWFLGVMTLAYNGVASIVDWVGRTVWDNTMTWGASLAGAGLLLLVIAGLLKSKPRSKPVPAAAVGKPVKVSSPVTAPQAPAKVSAPKPGADPQDAEVEEILRRRGIL